MAMKYRLEAHTLEELGTEIEKFKAWSESQAAETTRRLQSIEEKLNKRIDQC
jgi:hypothetical protein